MNNITTKIQKLAKEYGGLIKGLTFNDKLSSLTPFKFELYKNLKKNDISDRSIAGFLGISNQSLTNWRKKMEEDNG